MAMAMDGVAAGFADVSAPQLLHPPSLTLIIISAHNHSACTHRNDTMAPFSSTMIAAVALSALKYAAAFQPASPTFARRAMMSSGLRMASDNEFDDFSSKVRSYME